MNDKTLGEYERHESPDYADGGVAAALIEKEAEPDEGAHIGPEGEVDWHGLYLSENRRAEKAEREREWVYVRKSGSYWLAVEFACGSPGGIDATRFPTHEAALAHALAAVGLTEKNTEKETSR